MSKYNKGDKFEIEIEDVLTNEKGEVLYRLKPFAALTFNDYGLNQLKQIKPEIDWSKVKVDTPILVSGDNISWRRRHFAKYENGKVYAFDGGNTSWTGGRTGSWKYAKFAEV